MGKLTGFLKRLSEEPPFRLFTRAFVKRVARSLETMARWDVVPRPHYFVGVLAAAQTARDEGLSAISVAEFGVARGAGLLELQTYARLIEAQTDVSISVFGFDSGKGLPDFQGDYRDHPDVWIPGDFVMDWDDLREKVDDRTELILGDVGKTVDAFLSRSDRYPVGFASYDLDLYTSTVPALKILSSPERMILRRTFLYFDDTEVVYNHRFAGELLAIAEFNENVRDVKIDRWRGLKDRRPFVEAPWLERMYVAHDLAAIGAYKPARDPAVL